MSKSRITWYRKQATKWREDGRKASTRALQEILFKFADWCDELAAQLEQQACSSSKEKK